VFLNIHDVSDFFCLEFKSQIVFALRLVGSVLSVKSNYFTKDDLI
jgi:hypothetical protein